MTIFTTAAATIATALATAYGLGQLMPKSIYTEIEIEAPASAVWQEFADTAAYEDWNPFVRHLSGTWEAGGRLNVTVQSEGNAPMDFTPIVLAAEAEKELRWVGRLGIKGLFDGEHYFILEQTDRGTTLFRHGETFRGLLAYVIFPMIGADTEAGFNAMNAALKARVEDKA